MTDYGTIKIPREKFEKHNERRKGLDLSWPEYLDKESVTVETESVDYAEIERRVENVLEGIQR